MNDCHPFSYQASERYFHKLTYCPIRLSPRADIDLWLWNWCPSMLRTVICKLYKSLRLYILMCILICRKHVLRHMRTVPKSCNSGDSWKAVWTSGSEPLRTVWCAELFQTHRVPLRKRGSAPSLLHIWNTWLLTPLGGRLWQWVTSRLTKNKPELNPK